MLSEKDISNHLKAARMFFDGQRDIPLDATGKGYNIQFFFNMGTGPMFNDCPITNGPVRPKRFGNA